MKRKAVKQEINIENVIAELGLKKSFVAESNDLSASQLSHVINNTRTGGKYAEYKNRVVIFLKKEQGARA